MRRTREQGREASDRIGEGGGGVKKRKESHKGSRRDVKNGGDSGGRRKKRRHKGVGEGSVDVDPGYLQD